MRAMQKYAKADSIKVKSICCGCLTIDASSVIEARTVSMHLKKNI